MTPKTIIGFDLGSPSAYAVVQDGIPVSCGPWKWKGKVPDLKKEPGRRWEAWYKHIGFLIQKYANGKSEVIVAHEIQPQMHNNASYVLKGYENILHLACSQYSVRCLGVQPSSLKKYCTGSGKGDKEEMRKFLRWWFRRSNLEFNEAMNEHMVDATWVAIWGYRECKKK